MAEERLRQILQQSADEADQPGQGWGSIPSDVRRELQDRLKTTVDWRNVLRYFVKASQKAKRRSTIKRINRRYPYIHAGKRSDRVAKVAISIDQSGSVSDQMLAAFFCELEKLAQYAEFTVIPFDTEVAEKFVFIWKKGERKLWERVKCGGTCFNAPTKWVNARDFDGHIVLTDMECSKPVASKCQRMWMTDQAHADRPYFQTTERVIAINP